MKNPEREQMLRQIQHFGKYLVFFKDDSKPISFNSFEELLGYFGESYCDTLLGGVSGVFLGVELELITATALVVTGYKVKE